MTEISSNVPPLRVRTLNAGEVRPDADYVLYWMTACRRTRWSFALDRAVDWGRALGKPVVVLEALRTDYRWASDRLHRFVIDGMADNAARLAGTAAYYHPYVEPERGHGKGLLAALAARAAVVVGDDSPAFFLPRMLSAAAAQIAAVRFEVIDGNGLLPLRAADKVYKRAVDFRRLLQKQLPGHLGDQPRRYPFRGSTLPACERLPRDITERWPAADLEALRAGGGLAALPIDHDVAPVAYAGGARAADAQVERFLDHRLDRYANERNAVAPPATSGLSPYLHFGHVSPQQVFRGVVEREDWDPSRAAEKATGSRAGWWGMSEAGESFLDQLITWRELGFNMAWQVDDYDTYDSLPAWAQQTLEDHRGDVRPDIYALETFAAAETHDELWNAAQRELLRDGRIHNYLRMLWGKKILEWSQTPRDALAVMIELNNRYAVDGRDPNSYSGIFWCLGRYDRAWGPERPIFGKIRYMTSASTRRKLDAKSYIAEHGSF